MVWIRASIWIWIKFKRSIYCWTLYNCTSTFVRTFYNRLTICTVLYTFIYFSNKMGHLLYLYIMFIIIVMQFCLFLKIAIDFCFKWIKSISYSLTTRSRKIFFIRAFMNFSFNGITEKFFMWLSLEATNEYK